MEKANEKYLADLMELIYQSFTQVQIIRQELSPEIFILEVHCTYQQYRAVISEIVDRKGRKYAYYLLDHKNVVMVAFDNSPDRVAIELKYRQDWKRHFKERVCHQHSCDRKETMLSPEMTLSDFVDWLKDDLEVYISKQIKHGSAQG